MPSSNADHNHYTKSTSQSTFQNPDRSYTPLSARRYDPSATAASIAASVSPKNSLNILPASTYAKPTSPPSRRLSVLTKFPPQENKLQPITATSEASPDPREFYQLYDDPFARTTEALHQGNIAVTSTSNGVKNSSKYTRKSSFSSSHSTASATTNHRTKSPGGRRQLSRSSINSQGQEEQLFSNQQSVEQVAAQGTKPKLRDLVARFEQPTVESAPNTITPGHRAGPRSRAGSTSERYRSSTGQRKASISSNIGQVPADADRSIDIHPLQKRSNTGPLASISAAAYSHPELRQEEEAPYRRPLFGEILPTSTNAANIGYGISKNQRRGSEGNMHNSHPMFPEDVDTDPENSPTAWYMGHTASLQNQMSKTQQHRPTNYVQRLRSDNQATPIRTITDPGNATMTTSTPIAAISSRKNSGSKIPVSTRRYSHTSDSGNSSPSTRANSALGRYSTNVPLPAKGTSAIPRVSPTTAHPPRRTSTVLKSTPRSPPRRERVPDSPSLTANIIPPPPKVSPPLRSSRPRQPVSSASTSASRARAVDKFQGANDRTNGPRSSKARSQRLPELSNVNLAARRDLITSAFNKSVKESEEKAAERRRLAAERQAARLAERQEAAKKPDLQKGAPVRSQRPNGRNNVEPEVSEIPTKELAQEDVELSLDVSTPKPDEINSPIKLQAQTAEDDGDSPTLGHADVTLSPLVPRPSNPPAENDRASSASPANTDGTEFENEPQSESFDNPQGILNHVMQMRSSSPETSSTSSPLPSTNGSPSEDIDKESIQIMLRNTAVYDQPYQEDVSRHKSSLSQAKLNDSGVHNRWSGSSWTSSYRERDSTDDLLESIAETSPQIDRLHATLESRPSSRGSRPDSRHNGRLPRSASESEALNALNTMLDRVSDPRSLDKEAFNEIYKQIMNPSSVLARQGGWDTKRVTQLCLQQIAKVNGKGADVVPPPLNVKRSMPEARDNTGERFRALEALTRPLAQQERDESKEDESKLKPSAAKHRLQSQYRASLSHPDDFAMTSPSMMDWMQFAAQDSPVDERDAKPQLPPKDSHDLPDRESTVTPRAHDKPSSAANLGLAIRVSSPRQSELSQPETTLPDLPVPAHPPPPPPADSKPTPPVTYSSISPSIYDSQPPSSVKATFSPPQVPRRLTSLNGIRNSQESTATPGTSPFQTPTKSIAENGNSVDSPANKSMDSPDQRRLRKRKHVIKELIDTEILFGRDMKVVDDIYKGTSQSCQAVTTEDAKVLFGNTDEIADFSTSFLETLKAAARPIYIIDKAQRFQSKRSSTVTGSSISTGDQMSITSSETTDVEKDTQTTIGEAFLMRLVEMEKVYTVYLKNHDAANRKLQTLQKDENVVLWLSQCKNFASDLTSAWNLDALLVKPVQRVVKYPLLLTALLEATPADHPDYVPCQNALLKLTNMAVRINETKRQADLVEQVVGHRKRKESDGRTGLSKAFGRRTEKLRQHVGLSEMLEDKEYDDMKINFSYCMNQLEVVQNDFDKYIKSLQNVTNQLANFVAAIESWVYWPTDDRSHNAHARFAEKESRWLNYAQVIRQMISLALPGHIANVEKFIKQPLMTAWKSLHQYEKKFFEKRNKRLLDCARHKNLKARGEKIDKKGQQLIDQFDALNNDIKTRIPKMQASCAVLVDACQKNFMHLQADYNSIWQRKLLEVLDRKTLCDWSDIEKDQKAEENFVEAEVLGLGACNRSLLEDAPNYVSIRSPSATLHDADSSKRSVSLKSDGSPIYPIESNRQSSGSFPPNVEMPSLTGPPYYPDVRSRASSTVSGPAHIGPISPESGKHRSMTGSTQAGSLTRTSTSQVRNNEESPQLPRLSIETPSPSFGVFDMFQSDRPESGSTFFSAAQAPSASPPPSQNQTARHSLFNSAMPMPETPRNKSPEQEQNEQEPGIMFCVASVYEFNIDKSRRQAGYPYLTYITGEIFDVLGENGELWLARNQDDATRQVGWIWNKHFMRIDH